MKVCRSDLAAPAVLALWVAAAVAAQPSSDALGPGGPGAFGGPSGNLMTLLVFEAVRKEIKATEDQLAGIRNLREEVGPASVVLQAFDGKTQEEREKALTQWKARLENASAKLAEILKADQIARLEEISLQRRGAEALADPKVAEKLNLSDDQQTELKGLSDASAAARRELFQDRSEGLREKVWILREQTARKMIGVLTADQKAAFERMKGTEFKMEWPESRRPSRTRVILVPP